MTVGWGHGAEVTAEVTQEAQTAIAVNTRLATEWAAITINSGEVLGIEREDGEYDDGPDPNDVADGFLDDEDPPLLDDERDPLLEFTSFLPWISAAISVRADGDFDHLAEVPVAVDPTVARAYGRRRKDWIGTVKVVSSKQPAALNSPTAAEAAVRLAVLRDEDGRSGKSALERRLVEHDDGREEEQRRGRGQASRDTDTLVDTPFGPVPFWFFTGPAPNAQVRATDEEYAALLIDLAELGNALISGEVVVPEGQISIGEKTIEAFFNKLGRQPAVKAGTISKNHSKALVAVKRKRHIVARYRGLWPATDPDALLDQLGLETSSRGASHRSDLVAVLALAGVFDAALGIWEG